MKKVLVISLVAALALWLPSLNAQAGSSNAPRPDVSLATTQPFQFNGQGQSLSLGRSNPVNFGDGDFTVHVTVNFSSLGQPADDMSLVDKMSSPIEANTDGWRVLKQADNRFWFCLGGPQFNGCNPDGSDTTVISQSEAEIGVWHSVTAVKAGGSIQIYVDGALEGTTVLGSFVNTDSADLRIGANDPDGAFLHGLINDVRLFRQALNSGQVSAQHAQTISAHK